MAENGTLQSYDADTAEVYDGREVKRVGVLTSGGDCSGMNACVRSVVRTAHSRGIEVYGFRKGFQGLLNNDYVELDSRSVAGRISRGGTFLQTARCEEFKTDDGIGTGLENLIDLGVDGLVVVGGNGSLTGALKLHQRGFPAIGIPASIDNDLYGTDMAIGVDTALNVIVNSLDMIRDTASSHDRMFIIEVMGRKCGYLALAAAVATGSEAAIIPEVEYDIERLARCFKRRYKEKRSNSFVIVSEGAATATEIADQLRGRVGYDIRVSILGHIQRGGNPSFFDRVLASTLGRNAVFSLEQGRSGLMMTWHDSIYSSIPLEESLSRQRPLDRSLMDLAELLDSWKSRVPSSRTSSE